MTSTSTDTYDAEMNLGRAALATRDFRAAYRHFGSADIVAAVAGVDGCARAVRFRLRRTAGARRSAGSRR